MDDLISRQSVLKAINNMVKECESVYVTSALRNLEVIVADLPTAQPETHEERTKTHACDCISRQAAIDALTSHIMPHNNEDGTVTIGVLSKSSIKNILNKLPSAQPDSKELSFTQKKLDTISRQEAVSVIAKWMLEYGGEGEERERNALKQAAEEIKEFPSAQPDLSEYSDKLWKKAYERGKAEALAQLEEAYISGETEAEARYHAEIIACGDCKHWICHDRRCGYWNHGVRAIDWCSHAERRTDEPN